MITDAFAVLGLPRKAGLSAETVKAAFQQAAAASHPDAAGDEAERISRTEQFQKLNGAAAMLTPAASRLNHLLSLEYPDQPLSRQAAMSDRLVFLFTQVGEAVRAVEAWSKKRQAATGFLAKAALAADGIKCQEQLEQAGASLRGDQEILVRELCHFDESPPSAPGRAAHLGSLARRAAFLEKWQAQVQSAWGSIFAAE